MRGQIVLSYALVALATTICAAPVVVERDVTLGSYPHTAPKSLNVDAA